jgi:hypothetical protein
LERIEVLLAKNLTGMNGSRLVLHDDLEVSERQIQTKHENAFTTQKGETGRCAPKRAYLCALAALFHARQSPGRDGQCDPRYDDRAPRDEPLGNRFAEEDHGTEGRDDGHRELYERSSRRGVARNRESRFGRQGTRPWCSVWFVANPTNGHPTGAQDASEETNADAANYADRLHDSYPPPLK